MPLPAIDENRSLWALTAAPRDPCLALEGDRTADIVIIGGGFTGMSTAYHMARRFPERKIILLEARKIGNGGSGRNGGLMLNWVNGVEPGDPLRAKAIYDATREGIDGIAQIIATHKLDVRWRRTGSMNVHTRARGAEEAAAEVEALNAVGVPLQFLDGKALSPHLQLQGAIGAVLDPTAGHLDGISFLNALLPVVRELGVTVHENSPVVAIEEGARCVVRTLSGTVTAATLVLATNAYTPALGYFRDRIMPLHAHVVATAPLPRSDWAARGWGPEVSGFDDDLDRVSYGCMSADGQVVFGGGVNGAYGYHFGGSPQFTGNADFGSVERRLRAYLPAAAEVPITHRWTGPVALTWNRICAMGVRGAHRNVYYALGYAGHGVTLANLAGRVLTDVYSDADERWRGLPFYDGQEPTRMAWIPPEPLRWVGYHVMTRLTGKSPRKRGVRS